MRKSRDHSADSAKPTGKQRGRPATVSHLTYCAVGVGLALLWTGIGCGIALIQGSIRQFFGEWLQLQGFFLIAIGIWLLLIVRSGALAQCAKAVIRDSSADLVGIKNRALRFVVVASISLGGTASLVAMGF